MKRSRFTDEQIIAIVKEQEAGAKTADVCRRHGISDATFYKAKELLAAERMSSAGLFASAAEVDEVAPMLVDDLLREQGVSVIYGDMDEFKTTLVLDMMAHVSVGAPWQGRKVTARPVIWYAREDASEIPARLRALEARFAGKDTPWGRERLPITVRDRIPGDYRKWRAEIEATADRWQELCSARLTAGEMPTEMVEHPKGGTSECPRYPFEDSGSWPLVVVIDTLSIALGGEDEKGPRAVGFINDCLDLLKDRPDMARPEFSKLVGGRIKRDEAAEAEWDEQHPGEGHCLAWPVASHVIIIHHQTKTGTDFAGHRAIGANTQGLYRVHRFGKMDDANRPYAGMLTPKRTKGMVRPAPLRFEVAIVDVPGTKRTAAILKDRATDIPKELKPVIDALRELDKPEPISPPELNECIDETDAVSAANEGAAKRKARQRCREKLEAAGVIEPVEEDGKLAFYRFHDPGTA